METCDFIVIFIVFLSETCAELTEEGGICRDDCF